MYVCMYVCMYVHHSVRISFCMYIMYIIYKYSIEYAYMFQVQGPSLPRAMVMVIPHQPPPPACGMVGAGLRVCCFLLARCGADALFTPVAVCRPQ